MTPVASSNCMLVGFGNSTTIAINGTYNPTYWQGSREWLTVATQDFRQESFQCCYKHLVFRKLLQKWNFYFHVVSSEKLERENKCTINTHTEWNEQCNGHFLFQNFLSRHIQTSTNPNCHFIFKLRRNFAQKWIKHSNPRLLFLMK